jgi:hypothetical protein
VPIEEVLSSSELFSFREVLSFEELLSSGRYCNQGRYRCLESTVTWAGIFRCSGAVIWEVLSSGIKLSSGQDDTFSLLLSSGVVLSSGSVFIKLKLRIS